MYTPSRLSPLISLHLASNRPAQLSGFLENIERTIADPSSVEVLIKIDNGDEHTTSLIAQEALKLPYPIRVISSPREGGYFSLWKAYNALWPLTHPSTYFVSLVNDEIRFETPGWDRILAGYVDFWPDGMFRLRISRFRLRNYGDLWECGFAPDAFAIHTRSWIAAGGNWAPCNTPDAFQQMVAWRLWRLTSRGATQTSRDIPIHSIRLSGELPNAGLTEAQLRERVRLGRRHWYRLVSPAIQTECARRARLIEAHIWSHQAGCANMSIRTNERTRHIEVISRDDRTVLKQLDYRVSRWPLIVASAVRRPFHAYWCGGGVPMLAERWAAYRQDVIGWTLRKLNLARHRRSRTAFFLRIFLDDPRLFAVKVWRRVSPPAEP